MSEQDARATAKAAKAAHAAAEAVKEAERRAALARLVEQGAALEPGTPASDDRIDALAVAFCSLSEKKRSRFLRLVRDYVPVPAIIDLHAEATPQKLDYAAADIYLRVRTRQEQFRLRACAKEPLTVDWIHQHVASGDVLYDIGANVGTYSLLALKKPDGARHVVAFEPAYANVAALCENLALNGVADRVTPLPIALSDSTAMNVLNLRDPSAGAARHTLGDDDQPDEPTRYRQPVMTFRLDDAVEWFRLPPPAHIKLDVDGGELAVLAGAARTLSSAALRSMLVEVSVPLSDPVTAMLASHGLRLDAKLAVRNKSGEVAVWYGLFVRDSA